MSQHLTNTNRVQQLLYSSGVQAGEFEPATPAYVVRREGAKRLGKIAAAFAVVGGGLITVNSYLNSQDQAPIKRAEAEAVRMAEVGQATQILGEVVLVHGAHVRTEPIIVHTEADTSLEDNTVLTAGDTFVLHDPLAVDLYDAGSNESHTWYGVHTSLDAEGVDSGLVWVRDDATEGLQGDQVATLTDPTHFSGTLER
jgi:hypothetical protein